MVTKLKCGEYRKNTLQKIKTLVWGFIWGGSINQTDRNVCYLGVENGNTGMINMQEIIESKIIPNLHEPLESWNVIDKCWLRKLDIEFNENIFYGIAQMYKF